MCLLAAAPALGAAGGAASTSLLGTVGAGGLSGLLGAATTSTGLLLGSTLVSLGGQYVAAEAQSDFQTAQAQSQNEAMALNAKLANANYQNQILAAQQAEREAQDADAIKAQQNQIKATQAKATARVAAGESGVSGNSVELLLRDFEQQELAYSNALSLNARNRQRAGAINLETARLEAEGRVSSLRPTVAAPIEQPNFLGAAVSFGTGLSDINTQRRRDQRLGNIYSHASGGRR